MEKEPLPFYIFNTHLEADDAIKALSRAGFDVKKLSVVGKGMHSEDHAVGFYTTGDRIKSWGQAGAFWGGIWGILFTPAVFFIPGLGLIAMAGPIVSIMLSALEGAIIVGGFSALGAALSQLGVPKDQVIKYESAIKADKYVLTVLGSAEEIAHANSILATLEVCEVA